MASELVCTCMCWHIHVLLPFIDVLWSFSLESYTPGQVGTKTYKGAMPHTWLFLGMLYCCIYSCTVSVNRGKSSLHLIVTSTQLKFILVCTGMYEYVERQYRSYDYVRVCTSTYCSKRFHHGTYWYVRVCTSTFYSTIIHPSTYLYVRIRTRTNAYRQVISELQKVANRSRTRDILQTVRRTYHCTTGVNLEHRGGKSSCRYVHISCYCTSLSAPGV
jgi:hypothetical protein